jgi:hypothetical protein
MQLTILCPTLWSTSFPVLFRVIYVGIRNMFISKRSACFEMKIAFATLLD